MNTSKVSTSLLSNLMQEVLRLLRQKELESCYREASAEIDPIFDIAVSDGINDKTR
ncbi:MAG: hypothetical protein JSS53_06345 [Proteobacteria bacterium]|nr:hypothetical protein [Pseudomonadota bacterium]